MKIAFIGAGAMAEAIIARLKNHSIMASDVDAKRLNYLQRKYRIKTSLNNSECFNFGELVILAVKPQQMAEVLKELGARDQGLGTGKLVISIAAGIPISYLSKKLPGYKVIRAMPNNPALIGAGITALAKAKRVKSSQLQKARAIFSAIGEVVEVPEKLMDAVTGLSGSGPAYIYFIIEALIAGGKKAGMTAGLAARLAAATVEGAAAAVKLSGKSPAQLRAMVTSPGGTTIEGLAVLNSFKTAQAFSGAVLAAAKKSKLLSKKWT